MRINFKDEARNGDTRIKSKFLWLPKWGDDQVRWLEDAKWKEMHSPMIGWIFFRWID